MHPLTGKAGEQKVYRFGAAIPRAAGQGLSFGEARYISREQARPPSYSPTLSASGASASPSMTQQGGHPLQHAGHRHSTDSVASLHSLSSQTSSPLFRIDDLQPAKGPVSRALGEPPPLHLDAPAPASARQNAGTSKFPEWQRSIERHETLEEFARRDSRGFGETFLKLCDRLRELPHGADISPTLSDLVGHLGLLDPEQRSEVLFEVSRAIRLIPPEQREHAVNAIFHAIDELPPYTAAEQADQDLRAWPLYGLAGVLPELHSDLPLFASTYLNIFAHQGELPAKEQLETNRLLIANARHLPASDCNDMLHIFESGEFLAQFDEESRQTLRNDVSFQRSRLPEPREEPGHEPPLDEMLMQTNIFAPEISPIATFGNILPSSESAEGNP